MIVIAPVEETPVMLVSQHQRRQLTDEMKKELPAIPVCESPTELATHLFPGYRDWRNYRDHVLENPT